MKAIVHIVLCVVLLFCSATLAQNRPSNISIENEALSVMINTLGAELQSIRDKKTGTEHLWQGDPNTWSGRAPIMFPVNVCIEPMIAHHDPVDAPIAIEEKSHLIALPAGESETYRFSIIVHETGGRVPF